MNDGKKISAVGIGVLSAEYEKVYSKSITDFDGKIKT